MWNDIIRCDCDVKWYYTMWYDVIRCDMIWLMWHDMLYYDVSDYSLIIYDEWYTMIYSDVRMWYEMKWSAMMLIPTTWSYKYNSSLLTRGYYMVMSCPMPYVLFLISCMLHAHLSCHIYHGSYILLIQCLVFHASSIIFYAFYLYYIYIILILYLYYIYIIMILYSYYIYIIFMSYLYYIYIIFIV